MDITERRTAIDFTSQMRRLVDERYSEAKVVWVVLVNLNTHTGVSLYRAFEPGEARRCPAPVGVPPRAKARIMAQPGRGEVFDALASVPLGAPDTGRGTLVREIEMWEVERNELEETVQWRFTAQDARWKLSRLYPAQS